MIALHFVALQLLPDSPDASRHASHASGTYRSRLGWELEELVALLD
jgi:hypothetical protein